MDFRDTPDEAAFRGEVRAWLAEHLTGEFAPEAVSGATGAYNKVVPTPVTARSHAEVAGLFAGLPLVAPGVVPVSEWRPDTIMRQVVDLYGGIARIGRRRR